MNEAIVTKPFKGCPDGQPLTRQFEKGDVVTGDLARVAVEELRCATWKGKKAKGTHKEPIEQSADETREQGNSQ